jgi:small subunit ribosomal protein S1
MNDLLAQSSFDKLKVGAIIPGTITEIRQNEVVVDIGGKSEGLIPANEFLDIGELQIGSSIEVLVEKLEDKNGNPVLSFDKAEQKKNWDNILTKFPEGSIAAGRVKAKVKGGLIVSIGVDAFMPASHIDVQPPKNLDQYVGQTYDFKVLKIDLIRQNVVLSRRELIEEQRASKRRNLLESIQPRPPQRSHSRRRRPQSAAHRSHPHAPRLPPRRRREGTRDATQARRVQHAGHGS